MLHYAVEGDEHLRTGIRVKKLIRNIGGRENVMKTPPRKKGKRWF